MRFAGVIGQAVECSLRSVLACVNQGHSEQGWQEVLRTFYATKSLLSVPQVQYCMANSQTLCLLMQSHL